MYLSRIRQNREVKEEKKYSKVLQQWSVPFKQSKAAAWDELQSKIAGMEEGKVRSIHSSKRPLWWALSGAAMLALAAMFFLQNDEVRIDSGRTAISHVLPDGSEVLLNKNSSIVYSDDFSERSLTLEGEAFFQVEKGSRFDVNTAEGVVSVLGTSFNVFGEDDLFEVQCYTGKVKVSLADQDSQDRLLLPQEETSLSQGSLAEVRSFDGTAPMWMNGWAFAYDAVPLKKVLKDLERRYDVRIEWDEKGAETFTGEFETEDLDIALKTICLPYGFDYQIDESQIVRIFKK